MQPQDSTVRLRYRTLRVPWYSIIQPGPVKAWLICSCPIRQSKDHRPRQVSRPSPLTSRFSAFKPKTQTQTQPALVNSIYSRHATGISQQTRSPWFSPSPPRGAIYLSIPGHACPSLALVCGLGGTVLPGLPWGSSGAAGADAGSGSRPIMVPAWCRCITVPRGSSYTITPASQTTSTWDQSTTLPERRCGRSTQAQGKVQGSALYLSL